jgi:YVTN family beta-propeller protein
MATIARLRWLVAVSLLAGLAGCAQPVALREPLTATGQIKLPADQGKPSVDLLSLDSRSGRLYVPHASHDALDVIDVKRNRVVASISGLPGIKGVAVTSDPDIVFTSDEGNGTVGVVDVTGRKVLDMIPVGGTPDAIVYDSGRDQVIVSLGWDKKLALIDRANRSQTGSIDLPGKPELMTVDETGARLFVAIHDMDEVAVISLTDNTISEFYRACDIRAPTGVVYDPQSQRLFVASSKLLNIIDVLLDKCLGSVDLGSGTDQIAINESRHHVYTANAASSNLSVVDSQSMKPLGVVGTGPGAGTVAVDAGQNRVYVAIARTGTIAVFHDP